MPRFEVLPINEAQASSATGKRAQILREYMSYIEQVPAGQAGRHTRTGPGSATNGRGFTGCLLAVCDVSVRSSVHRDPRATAD
jgi:hypothetical protein